MPVITIRIGKGRSIETKRAAAQSVTDAAVLSLGVKGEWVTILFDEYDRENWATGGELHIDKFGPRASIASKGFLIIGTVRLPPAGLEKARAAMREMIMASRAESGCIEYSYSEDVLDPGLIHVKEIWVSREAIQAHFESAHLMAWRETWDDLQISHRDLKLYVLEDAVPI